MLKYYYFDRDFSNIICTKILDFFIEKVRIGDIIIIDKVFEEFKNWGMNSKEKKYFQNGIDKFKKDTTTPDFLDMVETLIDENKVEREVAKLSKEALDIEIQKYRDTTADLYLIAYCQKLKGIREDVILITEESKGADGKIIKKIPAICMKEPKRIRWENLPYVMFDFYKEELKFELKS